MPSDDVPPPGEVGHITPRDLHAWRAGGRSVQLVDVRQEWEFEAVRLDGAILVPLPQLPALADSLDPSQPTVVYCHHGARSFAAASWMAGHGFRAVWNLEGGIDRWSLEVDESLPRY